VRPSELAYCSSRGQRIYAEPRGTAAGYRWPQLSIHRGELLGVLHRATLARLGADRFHCARHLQSFRARPDGTVVGEFLDRSTGRRDTSGQADVLIGCDGVHSAVRAQLFPHEGPPLWNGITMWRGTTVRAPFLGGRTMILAGYFGRRVVVYPIRDLPDGSQLVNWVAEVRVADGQPMPKQDWEFEAGPADVLPYFASFRFDWLDIPELFERADKILQYPMVDRDPLPGWTLDPVSILGDAAHPMYPVGSNGASQAIIDARVLARELALQPSVAAALAAYEDQRRPATSSVVLANRQVGPERCMDLVEERAPDGFDDITSVIPPEELAEMATAYKRIAGFDPETLNRRASLGVSRGD
jgi:2-polyprenyl-6-methoxyphenol hydroxylase-like FAD-dependent oxidoreductase